MGMKLLLLFTALSFASLHAEEPKFFRGVSTDEEWPHRYIIELRGDDATVHVEQRIDPLDKTSEWFSWGNEVRTHKFTKGQMTFTCPWGVIGKALSIACNLKFKEMNKEGFDAVLTIESFEEDKSRDIKFTPIDPKQLAPTMEVIAKQVEQDAKK